MERILHVLACELHGLAMTKLRDSGAVARTADFTQQQRERRATGTRHTDTEFPEQQALLARALGKSTGCYQDGGVIASGYDAELDELRNLSGNAGQYLSIWN